jgi:sulfur carrier protein ThiS
MMEILLDGRKVKAAKAQDVRQLLARLSLNSEEVLVKVNGKLAPDSLKIVPKDEVKIMRVIFGG